jgi:hypothetical protein
MIQLASIAASAAIGVAKSIAGSVAENTASTNVSPANTTKLKKTATDFEKMFLENSLDRMTQSEGTDGPLGENGTGGGGHIGELAALYVDYQVNAWWKISLSATEFMPGGYYGDGHNGEWIRLEMTFTF